MSTMVTVRAHSRYAFVMHSRHGYVSGAVGLMICSMNRVTLSLRQRPCFSRRPSGWLCPRLVVVPRRHGLLSPRHSCSRDGSSQGD
jgi:hypothetical protein